jgi:acyl-CoA synthetase (NDP forming)
MTEEVPMTTQTKDKPITKRELGSWARIAITVIPIMGTILASTWAIAGAAKESETQRLRLEAEVAHHAAELKRHSLILDRVPTLETSLKEVSDQLKEHERWTRRLNDVLIRVETRLEIVK